MAICLERGADLHMAHLMLLPLTVSCFSKIQIGFTFLVPAHPGGPGQRAVKRVRACVRVRVCVPVPILLETRDTVDADGSSSKVLANCRVPRSIVRSILDATLARPRLDKSSHV